MVRKATSQDVATLAGVSRSAVSLVLNGRGDGNIAADKQLAILAAAKKLNYTPNSVALSLRNRRTSTIGVVTDAIATTAFGGGLLQGAAEQARQAGYLLLVVDTHYDTDREREAFITLRDRQVDGYLYAAMGLRPYTPPELLRSVPAMLANCFDPASSIAAVTADELAGGRAAAQILVDAGHTDIVMLAGTTDVEATHHRIEGYRQVLSEAGLPVAEPIISGWEIDKGYQAAIQVLSGPRRPTGVLCANDRAAVGVVLAAGRLGLAVPEDLSVVGYDDDENVAPCMAPRLTTIALPHRQIGEESMRMLLSQLSGGARPAPVTLKLPCPPVLRDSVAAPRRSRVNG
ncbi:LacI family DNA-binding transcriptional regulator [Microlunatus panaciterrae]|uniref:LacI family transcriptional regulator n=1 Tax=Microlunatus panaciterrae TaxID=400768 RepID=A0ABS2RL53_9ACTN|nr:LacI family DNA-binding transcriptional regulator [Microlunatus panaciterrae]MBM7799302.1 LacI family transcriptional regulator [Microlunatus panaciterrae]